MEILPESSADLLPPAEPSTPAPGPVVPPAPDATARYLAYGMVAGFLLAVLCLFFFELPQKAENMLMFLLGTMTGNVNQVYSYYFGSSATSDVVQLRRPSVPQALPGTARASSA